MTHSVPSLITKFVFNALLDTTKMLLENVEKSTLPVRIISNKQDNVQVATLVSSSKEITVLKMKKLCLIQTALNGERVFV